MNSFKHRVLQFWDWFKENKNEIESFLDENKWQEAADFLKPALSNVFHEVTFEVRKLSIYEMILSPSGDLNRKLLIRYLIQCSPEIENWTFYSEMPPKTGSLTYKGEHLYPDEFLIYPEVSEEKHRISLAIYAPVIENRKEKEQFTVVYIMLNNLLGENMFEHYIGEVYMVNPMNRVKYKNKRNLKLSSLYKWIDAEITARNWIKASDIIDIIEEYNGNPKVGKGLRYDITSGKTCQFLLCNEYYGKTSASQTYVKSVGASYCFLSTDPKKGKVDSVREYIINILKENDLGILIGEAKGLEYAYLDILLFSPEEFCNEYKLNNHDSILHEFHE